MTEDNFPTVEGYCPMGCGESLYLAGGGYVTCRSQRCPRPDAVSTLLEDREAEHIVEFYEDTFTVRHPLRERIDDALMSCELHSRIAGLSGPPVQLGRYRATEAELNWVFTRVDGAADGGQ
jgi:hypothetical protein